MHALICVLYIYLPTLYITTLNAHALTNAVSFFLLCTFFPLPDSVDVNECSIYGTCSQLCHNTHGSFTCKCVAGYEMVDHPTMGRICKPIGKL